MSEIYHLYSEIAALEVGELDQTLLIAFRADMGFVLLKLNF